MIGHWRTVRRGLIRTVVGWCSRPYIAGPALADAHRACLRFRDQGAASTIGYFNGDDESAQAVANASLATLEMLAREQLDVYLSVKAPALKFDDRLLSDITDRARAAQVGVHFDSHGPELADATFAAVAAAENCGAQVGCTLPGRWLRSVGDAEAIAARALRVRVVKGQWADPGQPGRDPRAGYLAVIDRLAGRTARVAVATHDPLLARAALQRLQRAGTPCELELLFGLPMRASLGVARELGVAARVYVPYGTAWMPYALGQIKRNPRMLAWVARDGLAGLLGRG